MGGRRRPGVRESGASVTARLEDLEGNLVALDTAPVIYLVEAHPVYQDVARPFFDALETGRLRMVTSILTLLEVLVYPLREDNPTLAARYRDILLATRGLSVLDATESITRKRRECGRHTTSALWILFHQVGTSYQQSAIRI